MPAMVPVCVRIEFGFGTILRYANDNLCRVDGGKNYAWEGRCKTPLMTWDLGPQDQAFATLGASSITIDNADGALDQYLPGGASYNDIRWPGARIDIYTGGSDGDDITTMAREFSGTVVIGGLRATPNTVILQVNDLRERHNVSITPYVVTSGNNPNARSGDIGSTVPVVAGDFTGITDAQAFVCLCVDTTTRQFKCNNGPIDSSTLAVYKDGAAISTTGVTEATGLFTIGALDYDVNSVYTAKFYGYPAGDTDCPTSYHPVDVIYWLIATMGGVDASDIDTATFTTAESDGDPYSVRRAILDETTVFQEVNRCAFESGYDVFVNRSGKYEIKWFAPVVSSSSAELSNRNIIDGVFTTELDPDQIYCNRVTASYDTLAGAYKTMSHEDSSEQTTFGRVAARGYTYYWLYNDSDVLTSLQRKLFFWSRMPETIDIEAVWESSDTSDAVYSAFLTDEIRVTLYRYDDASFMIRRCGLDLLSGKIGFRAVNMDSIPAIGLWDDNTLPNPGYWGDGSGIGYPYKTYWW